MKVAVIGVGYLGNFHAQKYASLEGVELVGVCDKNNNLADKVSQELNTASFYDYKTLPKLDAVSIVTSTKSHFEVAKYFLENNTNVLVEKPITTTVEEAEELIKIAKNNGLVLQVGHLERFNPALIKASEFLDKPNFIEAHRLAPFNSRGSDVNVILDLMIHDIEIIQYLLRCNITNIKTVGVPVLTKQVDICNARLEFENSCVANVSASRVSMKSERKMRIFQKNMYMVIDFQEKNLHLYKNDLFENSTPSQSSINSQLFTFDSTDAIKEEIIAFLSYVRNQTPPVVSGEDGKDALLTAINITNKITGELN